MNIHSCSYHCHLPGCIKAQRDELRDKLAALVAERDALLEALEAVARECRHPDYDWDNGTIKQVQDAIEAAKRQEGL
jgi:hypothetical protein